MPSISFQQAFALTKGVFISNEGNTKFDLTGTGFPSSIVTLSGLVSNTPINLNPIPALSAEGVFDPGSLSFTLSSSATDEYKSGGDINNNGSITNTERLYHIAGQRILKKLK